MANKANIEVEIMVMDRHFLYLPLYLAQFDSPESGKLPFFGKVPPEYSVRVLLPPKKIDRTDNGVFDKLMNARLASSPLMFAVCDPTVLLKRENENARMAASLVASSAFWAVNHDAKGVRTVSDLSSFARILCYKRGTTSNLIARWIAKQDSAKLIEVDSIDEIRMLEEYGEGTLAISPEVLHIANLIHGPLPEGAKRAEIVFELCTSKEFSNVLTTALFTRVEVLDKYPELVSGVLAALQSALFAIHAGHPIVKECVKNNFPDPYFIDQALALANSGNVFPETIQVRRDRWQRACAFYHISQALAEGREKSELTDEEQRSAELSYQRAVLDSRLQSQVAKAITCGFSEVAGGGSPAFANDARRWPRRSILLVIGLLVTAFGAGQAFATVASGAKFTIGSWVLMLLAGWFSGELAGYRKVSRWYVTHWISFVLFWWPLHEFIAPGYAYFIPHIMLNRVLAGCLLMVTASAGIVASLRMRSQVSKESPETTSVGHVR